MSRNLRFPGPEKSNVGKVRAFSYGTGRLPASPGVLIPRLPVLYSFCPSRYWPTVAVASSRGGALEYRASLVRTEYEAAASALDARTAAWYRRSTGTAPAPVGAPTAVDILASFPPVRGLVFGSACGGSREVGVLLAQAASSSAQRQWRSLGARLAPAPCSTRGPS